MEDIGNMDWDSIICGWVVIGIGVCCSYAAYLFGEYPSYLWVSACMMLFSVCVALMMND